MLLILNKEILKHTFPALGLRAFQHIHNVRELGIILVPGHALSQHAQHFLLDGSSQ